MKADKIFFILLFTFFMLNAEAQRFQFGVMAGPSVSQIEGDKLRGFNKFGYNAGLMGGYSFNENQYFVMTAEISTFGSNRKNEELSNFSDKMLLELDLTTINILAAFSQRFGETWDGDKKYRFVSGFKFHKTVNSSSRPHSISFSSESFTIPSDAFKEEFVSLNIGFGVVASEDIRIDLKYDHILMNLLNTPQLNITKLAPFQFALYLSYYF